MEAPLSFDPVWETKYSAGHQERYPWDAIVSFVFRFVPRDLPRSSVRILEIGCGTGSNLWFAAREGFCVAGMDGSASAIETARARFAEEGLFGDFRIGDFTETLPYDDHSFDLVIDRCSLTCVRMSDAQAAVGEIHRILKPGAKFHFNPYSATHTSSHCGTRLESGLIVDIAGGTLQNVGQICFYDSDDIDRLFANRWRVIQKAHLELQDTAKQEENIHAEWRVVAETIT